VVVVVVVSVVHVVVVVVVVYRTELSRQQLGQGLLHQGAELVDAVPDVVVFVVVMVVVVVGVVVVVILVVVVIVAVVVVVVVVLHRTEWSRQQLGQTSTLRLQNSWTQSWM